MAIVKFFLFFFTITGFWSMSIYLTLIVSEGSELNLLHVVIGTLLGIFMFALLYGSGDSVISKQDADDLNDTATTTVILGANS